MIQRTKLSRAFYIPSTAPFFSICVLFLLAVFTLICCAETPLPALMPVPQQVSFNQGKFLLTDSFTVAVAGQGGQRLFNGATRMLRRLSGRTGLFFPQDFITAAENNPKASLILQCDRRDQVRLNEDEAYLLTVTPAQIFLKTASDIGALRGLETLLQLLQADESGYFFPAVEIHDSPRFPWRGLLMDVGRHFMPVDVIERNLDGMAAVKLNVLHWHLSEDQGFRVECLTWPKLHELGSDGLYYTQAQIKEVINYAADRGIRVVPEFDIPGHATSWLVAYPELASLPGPYTIERKWGVCNPTFDPTNEKTYEFFDAFFKEMASLFPDEYMHIGGDENNGKQWDANPNIQKFMKDNNISNNHALQAYFNKRILAILTKYGKKMVGWDEILHPEMPTNIVIQSWRGRDAMIESAKKGYQVMLSNGYYIDLIQPTDFLYLNDPIPDDSPLTDAEKRFILGGEATMWAEFVTPETVDSRIWPRTAAIAERLWSPGSVRNVQDMYRRLENVSFRMEELGLMHEKNYLMMLRRLTGNQDISALKNLVDVIEPVKIYARYSSMVFTSFYPCTRVVDAARPDAAVARHFNQMVDDFKDVEEIRKWLQLWAENHETLVPIIKKSPILTEIESLSADLAMCGIIGLEALVYVEKGQRAETSWQQGKLAVLEHARAPRGQTELMIIPAIEKLVKKAGE
jgi:hexosaminidase